MHAHIGDWRCRQVLSERLPVATAIERDKGTELGADVEQTLTRRIFSNDTSGMVDRNSVLAVGQERPALAVVLPF